jgi:hypothetical protein
VFLFGGWKNSHEAKSVLRVKSSGADACELRFKISSRFAGKGIL